MLRLQLNEVELSPIIIGAGSRDIFKILSHGKRRWLGMKNHLEIETRQPSWTTVGK